MKKPELTTFSEYQSDAPNLVSLLGVVVSVVGTLITIAVFQEMFVEGYVASYGVASCLTTNCFCEQPRTIVGMFVQPSNTYSSFAFVWIGLLLAFVQARESATWRRRLWPLPTIAITVGLSSAYFHSTLSFIGQFLDVFAMHALVFFILLVALRRLFGMNGVSFGVAYWTMLSCTGFLLYNVPVTRRYLFALLVVLSIVLEVSSIKRLGIQIASRYFWIATMSLAVGYAVWFLDNKLILCSGNSWLQGHGFWHAAGAVSIALLYRYYRSEKIAH